MKLKEQAFEIVKNKMVDVDLLTASFSFGGCEHYNNNTLFLRPSRKLTEEEFEILKKAWGR